VCSFSSDKCKQIIWFNPSNNCELNILSKILRHMIGTYKEKLQHASMLKKFYWTLLEEIIWKQKEWFLLTEGISSKTIVFEGVQLLRIKAEEWETERRRHHHDITGYQRLVMTSSGVRGSLWHQILNVEHSISASQ